jgi:transposase-like protein
MRALSRKKSKAILALLENRTVGEAAESVGVGQSTLFRWMQDHNFQRHYLQAKRRVVDHAITQLQKMTGEAVQVLNKIMIDDTNPPTSRIACAKAILDQALKGFELEDLATRIDALEKALQNR